MITKIAEELSEFQYTPEEALAINLSGVAGGVLGAGAGYTGSAAASLAGAYKDSIKAERASRILNKESYPKMLSEAKARLDSAKKALEFMTDDLVEGNIKKYPHIAENADEYREKFRRDRDSVAQNLKKEQQAISELSEKMKKPMTRPDFKTINDTFKREVVGGSGNPTMKEVIKKAPKLNINRGINGLMFGGLLGSVASGIAAQHHALKQREEN